MAKVKELVIILVFLLSLTFVSAVGEYTVDENTVALWHFNEGSGSTVFDETTNNNDGTIFGATWISEGKFGNALRFDGTDDLITITKTPSVDLTTQVTLEAWVKRDLNTDGIVIAKNGPYYLSINNDVVRGGVYANDGNCPTSCVTPGANTWTYVNGTTSLQVNQWYHLAMSYDGSKVRIFVNGVEENSAPKIGQMPQVSQIVIIGWGEPGLNWYFNGIIDEVRLSDIARTFDVTEESEDNLTARVEKLEKEVAELKEELEEQRNTLSVLQNAFNSFVNYINELLSGLPRGLREQMVCNTLENGENTTALGLFCQKMDNKCMCKNI